MVPTPWKPGAKVHWYTVLARQFVDVLIFILIVAAAISIAVGEMADAITIMVIVVLNGVLGFVQEWKAERAIEALQRMLAPHCKVVRDGHEQAIDAKGLVPGDIVMLEIGDRVPGDLRLVEALDLRLDESSLTGESESVSKGIDPAHKEAPPFRSLVRGLDGHGSHQRPGPRCGNGDRVWPLNSGALPS